MVQDGRKTEHLQAEARRQKAELDAFEACLREAYRASWWRRLVSLVGDRREIFKDTLAGGYDLTTGDALTQRQEDRIRGQISECTFILSLDKVAETKEKEAQGSDGTE